jgi:hypothetical protein
MEYEGNDDDWEFELDNGQIESIADRISSIAAAESREKRLEERRLQEEADRALTEDLFAEGRSFGSSILPQVSSPPKKQIQDTANNKPPKKIKLTVKLPELTLKKPDRPPNKISKAKQKYIEAELFGDSTYLTQDEIIGCEYEEEYYGR